MKFKSVIPILRSSDVTRSISYYVDKLGFENQWEWDSPPTFGGVSKDKLELFFCKDGQGNPGTWLSVFVDDIDEYYNTVKENGAKVLAPPKNMEWGVREMLVEDPDGHFIRFGQNLSELLMPVNAFTSAIRALDLDALRELLQREPQWATRAENDGRNGLHYLCSLDCTKKTGGADASLSVMRLLVSSGMDINSIHQIPEKGEVFPATPIWYAYAKGKNKKLYTWLLENGANPGNCMFAVAWQNDVAAATLFKKHGAAITDVHGKDMPFLAAVGWRKLKVARWFLENGADVNVADEAGNTALHLSVRKNYPTEFIRLLLKHGADSGSKNSEGSSSLQLAEKSGIKLN